MVRELFRVAWDRFKIIGAIVGDTQARIIAMLFYFTILVPFGVGSRLLSDPLRLKHAREQSTWLSRDPLPTDLDSAKQQG
ncbi:MAG: hypothetical protein HZC41_18185 [Chloroflexi bacterium]|nr:hypothetical protein [Chloroflexota bacterium]